MLLLSSLDYRQIPAVSNSDLTELRNHLFGYPQRGSTKAFLFGEILHRCLLERGELADETLPKGVKPAHLQPLLDSARRDPFLRWVLRFGVKEKAHFFTDPATGLPCKCKTDVLYKHRLIVDVKTTSQPNRAAFLESCHEYDYHRQAAFYLDGVGARRFVFVGIQKKDPFDLFYFEPTGDRSGAAFLREGRQRYRRLLKAFHEVSFRPSSWGPRLSQAA